MTEEAPKKKRTSKKKDVKSQEFNLTQELLTLFEARSQVYTDITNSMMEVVNGTTLMAMRELFGVPEEDITWTDLDIRPGFLLVSMLITLRDGNASTILSKMLEAGVDEDVEQYPVQRFMKLGIPIDMVFSPKQEIVDYFSTILHTMLLETASELELDDVVNGDLEEQDNDEEPEDVISVPLQASKYEFDAKALTKEQKQSLLYFQHMSRGKIH